MAIPSGNLPIAQRALDMIQSGQVVGLGSGRAATEFIIALGERVREGLSICGVPTSEATADLARKLGIPLASLGDLEGLQPIDIDVDGADEVDPQLNLIKGLGGALVREKIVAAASRKLVILVGPGKLELKLSPVLGTRGVLPVEVLPFGWKHTQRRLQDLGYPSKSRTRDSDLFVSDNGNYILDCTVSALSNPMAVDQVLLGIPGVVGTGLFLGMAPTVLIQDGDVVRVREPAPAA